MHPTDRVFLDDLDALSFVRDRGDLVTIERVIGAVRAIRASANSTSSFAAGFLPAAYRPIIPVSPLTDRRYSQIRLFAIQLTR